MTRDVIVAFMQGKERGLAGASSSENPHKALQYGERNRLHDAWAEGHLSGREQRRASA